MFSAAVPEDEVVFTEANGQQRVLRGEITLETPTYIVVSRRDGDHQIMMSTIRKIVRRSAVSKGLISRALDASRAKEESVRQAAASAMSEAAVALESALARNDAAEITTARKRLADARTTWRAIR